MSGEVQLKTIADYQAAIQKLDRNKPADRAKIMEYTHKIGELLAGKKEPIDTESMSIKSQMGVQFSVDAQIAQDPQIKGQEQYKDKNKIKDEFGSKLTDAEWKALENEYKTAEKELKAAQKANKKVKYSDYKDKAKYKEDKSGAFQAQAEAAYKFQEVKARYDKEKIRHDISKGHGDDGIKKAAKHNVKNFTNVQNVQHVFLSKEEEKAAIKANPALEGHTKVLKGKDVDTLRAISTYADYRIKKEAQKLEADKKAAAEAIAKDPGKREVMEAEVAKQEKILEKTKEKYEEYQKMFDENDNLDVRKAQNALVDESGFDENFNVDEIKAMSNMYEVSKGDIKSVVKKLGYGTENLIGKRLAAAGVTAAATAIGSLVSNHKVTKTSDAHSIAHGETVRIDESFLASNGEFFRVNAEAQGGVAKADAFAKAVAKIPVAAQLAGPALAGLSAFFLAKPQTEDAFKGNVEAVLSDINLVEGKDNKAIVNNIQDMEITGDKEKDDMIKAAVLKAALGENTKKANTEELLAAYENLKDAKEAIGKIEIPTTPPPTPPVNVKKPDLDIEDEKKVERIAVRTGLPRMPLREGAWYTSHGYVDENGNKLTEAERKMVQKELSKPENRIGFIDTNHDGKADSRDKMVSLPTEISLPNGKRVKLAPDARARIMKLPAKGGGKNGKYTNAAIVYDKLTHKYYVIDKNQGNKRVSVGFDSREQAEAEKTRLEQAADEKK